MSGVASKKAGAKRQNPPAGAELVRSIGARMKMVNDHIGQHQQAGTERLDLRPALP